MRACITHFDGDPLVLDFWLMLYRKFWRGEVDTIYAKVCYFPEIITPEIIEQEKKSFSEFPEIKVEWQNHPQVPEISNGELIKKSTEDHLMLLESDGWIFGKGLVDKHFKIVEGDMDIVAGNYKLLGDVDEINLGYSGFMRNFFFCKTSVLKSIDLDFMPKQIPGKPDLDCFGWICLQLAQKKVKVHYISTNMVDEEPAPAMSIDSQWLHIRHFNSSLLGFGNYGDIFKGFKEDDRASIEKVRGNTIGSPTAEWMYCKAIAFRFLMMGVMKPKGAFYDEYQHVLFKVISELQLDMGRIYTIRDRFLKVLHL